MRFAVTQQARKTQMQNKLEKLNSTSREKKQISFKMSKPTALHTEDTAQVSEWLNISDAAKKLY